MADLDGDARLVLARALDPEDHNTTDVAYAREMLLRNFSRRELIDLLQAVVIDARQRRAADSG